MQESNTLSKSQQQTLESIEKIHQHPCYLMHYYGDYHLEDYLKKGANSIDELVDIMEAYQLFPPKKMDINIFGCTCFKVRNKENQVLVGRNFDWHKKSPALLVTTQPKNCYKSMSMVDIGVLGYVPGDIPQDQWGRRHLLCSPYLPADGMNEKGVSVAILTLPRFEPMKVASKPSLFCNTVLRLILDYAGSVSEIQGLLDYFSISTFFVPQRKTDLAFHLFVADESGDSAVIEFEGGKVHVLREKDPWQIITNFNLQKYQQSGKVEGTGFGRYKKASQYLSRVQGTVSDEDSMLLLKKCRNVTGSILFNAFGSAQTRWSMLYNVSEKVADLVMEKDYQNIKHISL